MINLREGNTFSGEEITIINVQKLELPLAVRKLKNNIFCNVWDNHTDFKNLKKNLV